MNRKNRSVISSINKSATLFKCLKPPSFKNKSDKMCQMMDSSVTPTIAKCVPPKMRRSKRLETRRSALIPRNRTVGQYKRTIWRP